MFVTLNDAMNHMRKAMLVPIDASDGPLIRSALELLERVLGPLARLPRDELEAVLVELSVALEPAFVATHANDRPLPQRDLESSPPSAPRNYHTS